jgi:hypothetical protein
MVLAKQWQKRQRNNADVTSATMAKN